MNALHLVKINSEPGVLNSVVPSNCSIMCNANNRHNFQSFLLRDSPQSCHFKRTIAFPLNITKNSSAAVTVSLQQILYHKVSTPSIAAFKTYCEILILQIARSGHFKRPPTEHRQKSDQLMHRQACATAAKC
jgi:hypothetical protein